MSSEFFRNLLNKMVLTESVITESYDDRVANTAKLLANLYGEDKISKENAEQVMDTVYKEKSSDSYYNMDTSSYPAIKSAMVELRSPNERTFKEAKRDILKYMAKNGLLKRNTPEKSPRSPYYVENQYGEKTGVSTAEVNMLGHALMQAAGDSFPDGDPNDAVMSWIRRQGWDVSSAYDKLVPVACKNILGTKSYDQYLAQLWDDIYADAKHDHEHGDDYMYDMLGGDNAQNPWR